MSDDVLSTLITVLGGIITALIAAYVPYLMYSIEKRKTEVEEQRFAREQVEANRKGGKGRKPSKTTPPENRLPPKPTIDWLRTVFIGVVAAGILFSGQMIYVSASARPSPTATASLAVATVEFRISSSKLQIIVPAGGTLDTLHPGDQVSIETLVKDANKNPYPNPVTITYYFSSGEDLVASVAPYLAGKSDTITVKIEDQVTGEVITRIMRVSIWIEPT